MGRLNSLEEHRATVKWATEFEGEKRLEYCSSIRELTAVYQEELQKYFALSVLGQSKSADAELVQQALDQLFRIRVQIEKAIAFTFDNSDFYKISKEGNFFGASKKQGVSIRMPLWTCEPSKLCSNRCYAHDTLDAAPASVVRGAINGQIAERFESGTAAERKKILDSIDSQINKAIKACVHEAANCGWDRAPRIRFSHVGDIVAYADFANEMARLVKKKSEDKVACVVYTRRPEVANLDPDLWVINFTLDPTSENRASWIPDYAHTVYSAFDGVTSETAYVNFLEHHRWSHCSPKGSGVLCPATLPEAETRTCDSLFCNRCFVNTKKTID